MVYHVRKSNKQQPQQQPQQPRQQQPQQQLQFQQPQQQARQQLIPEKISGSQNKLIMGVVLVMIILGLIVYFLFNKKSNPAVGAGYYFF